jgi:sulfatase maturation enzyme AslB (radical SAM superfamily)
MSHPIFQIAWKDHSLIYDPYNGIIENVIDSTITKLSGHKKDSFFRQLSPGENIIEDLFSPTCLTLFTSTSCNLSGSYCYAQPARNGSAITLNPSAVSRAAELVAQNCQKQNKPFVLGFHGGNEPLSHPELVTQCLEICREVATLHSLRFLSFCTTNGAIPGDVATWAAQTFHGIRLSWDGPPWLHNMYRKFHDGKPISQLVENTAKICRDPKNKLRELSVRSTVTNDSVHHLSDILRYFSEFGIQAVDLQPVFQTPKKTIPQAVIPDAKTFVKQYIAAKKEAESLNMNLLYAGSRLNEFHDKHCLVYQHNLSITPDGYATSCFLATENQANQNQGFIYGWYDPMKESFIIDQEKLRSIYQQLSVHHVQCNACFNFVHCSKGCPKSCPIKTDFRISDKIDCTIEKWIGLYNILESAHINIDQESLHSIDDFFENVTITQLQTRELYSEQDFL